MLNVDTRRFGSSGLRWLHDEENDLREMKVKYVKEKLINKKCHRAVRIKIYRNLSGSSRFEKDMQINQFCAPSLPSRRAKIA
jgi:hypothetical protein